MLRDLVKTGIEDFEHQMTEDIAQRKSTLLIGKKKNWKFFEENKKFGLNRIVDCIKH